MVPFGMQFWGDFAAVCGLAFNSDLERFGSADWSPHPPAEVEQKFVFEAFGF